MLTILNNKQLLLTVPIDTTSKTSLIKTVFVIIFLAQVVILFYGLILFTFFLEQQDSVYLTAHIFANTQMQLLKIAAARGLGDSLFIIIIIIFFL